MSYLLTITLRNALRYFEPKHHIGLVSEFVEELLTGRVINGSFGMLLDSSKAASKCLKSILFWNVNNGIARRS